MGLTKKSLPVLLTTAAVLAIVASELNAESSPFDYKVFRSASYQLADLDEDGCGGAMTEYRRTPEEEKPAQDQTSQGKEADSVKTRDIGVIDKIKLFWSNLFAQTDK